MNQFQKEIIEKSIAFRPNTTYPSYPPYHKGDYIEEYFYKYFINNKIETERYYIPIFWTTCYNENKTFGLQDFLNQLDKSKKYFTVSQHDDAVKEILPNDTLSFIAGGRENGIAIPLTCSKIENTPQIKEKEILCSFVGTYSYAQGPIRFELYNQFFKDPDFYFSKPRVWSPVINEEHLNEFKNITNNSHFTLCPRGYGCQSFRINEAIQLNSIPVFIYDKEWFPFEDEVNWNSFCVRIHRSEIPNLKEILLQINQQTRIEMLKHGVEIYEKYFTLEGCAKNIIKRL